MRGASYSGWSPDICWVYLPSTSGTRLLWATPHLLLATAVTVNSQFAGQ